VTPPKPLRLRKRQASSKYLSTPLIDDNEEAEEVPQTEEDIQYFDFVNEKRNQK
jgi:hypothetical protein